jgi:L-rhamnose mutarotase
MIVKAFRMRVHPGSVAEYERRHNPIWPELEATLRAHGVSRYFIFLDDTTCDLFAYAEIESDERWQAIAATDVCRRWWDSMQSLMPSNPDASPESRDLRQVFQL